MIHFEIRTMGSGTRKPDAHPQSDYPPKVALLFRNSRGSVELRLK